MTDERDFYCYECGATVPAERLKPRRLTRLHRVDCPKCGASTYAFPKGEVEPVSEDVVEAHVEKFFDHYLPHLPVRVKQEIQREALEGWRRLRERYRDWVG